MKILYIGLLRDYGKKEQGHSYEYQNIQAGMELCADKGMFDLVTLHPDDMSKDQLRQRMGELVLNDSPVDVIFSVPFNEHLDVPHEIMRLAALRNIPRIEWDCDASWRFNNFIVGRRDLYSHFVTTHSSTVEWYKRYGMNVIKSQWGGSPSYVRDTSIEKIYDITFIGQKHGIRPEIVSAIQGAGINLHLFGNYWDGYSNSHGYIDFEEMVKVFQQSRICLNMSNPWHINTLEQIKGRHFEIPQLGAFQLSTPADDLETYFKDGEEISIARSVQDLIEKIKYYLANPVEREAIAEAGYERTMKEHQWEHRFEHILKEVGVL